MYPGDKNYSQPPPPYNNNQIYLYDERGNPVPVSYVNNHPHIAPVGPQPFIVNPCPHPYYPQNQPPPERPQDSSNCGGCFAG